jgi:hypothetical protein
MILLPGMQRSITSADCSKTDHTNGGGGGVSATDAATPQTMVTAVTNLIAKMRLVANKRSRVALMVKLVMLC